jgi:hypothetical protein
MATVPNRPAFCSESNWKSYTWPTYIAAGGNTATGPMYSPSTPNIEVLPRNGAGFDTTSFDTNGNILNASAESHLTSLLTTAGAVPPLVDTTTGTLKSSTSDPSGMPNAQAETPENLAATFSTKAKNLRASFMNEYCFYHSAYVFALEKLLTAATNQAFVDAQERKILASRVIKTEGSVNILYGGLTGSGNSIAPTGLMGHVYILNSKLNQLIQLMNKLQSVRLSSLNTNFYGVFSDPNSNLNKPLSEVQRKLNDVSTVLTKGDFEMSAKQSMIDYTLEKNSSSRNLLAVYGFMNIVAVGLLFYLYKAAK